VPLFHVHPTLLQIGSVVLPGNFGRILRRYAMRDVQSLYFREYILEEVRRSHFEAKPSRFDSIFCLESLDKAQFYRDNLAQTQIVYAVELVDAGCIQHRGDFNKVAPANSALASAMLQASHDYWNVVNIEHPEIVAASAIRIIEQIG
jgi:hypothetical protein